MSMNVPVMRRTTVTPMPCAPTLKDHLSADVFEVMKAMAETVQVLIFFGVKLHITVGPNDLKMCHLGQVCTL